MNTNSSTFPNQLLLSKLAELKKQTADLPKEHKAAVKGLIDDLENIAIQLQGADSSAESSSKQQETGSSTLKILDAIPALMWRSDLDSKGIYFNQTWLEFTGRTLEQELGDGWTASVHPDDLDHTTETYLAAFEARQPFEVEYRLRHQSGEYRWILDSGRPLWNEEGEFAGYIGTCFDLTERKQMEQALQDSAAMFRGLFEFAPDAIIAVDRSGKIRHANKQAESLFGYSRAELIGKPVEVLVERGKKDEHSSLVLDYFREPDTRRTTHASNIQAQRNDGSQVIVDITLGPLETRDGVIVLAAIRDATERKVAEEALREQEQLITSAISTAPIIFFKINPQGIVQLSIGNSPVRVRSGESSVGKSIYDVYAENSDVLHSFERAMTGEAFTTTLKINGRAYYTNYAPLLDENQEVISVTGVASDVTEYKQVVNALNQSEARFRTIFEQANLGIKLIDSQGRIIESNPAFQKMLGYSAEELREMTYTNLTHPDDRIWHTRLLEELLSGKRDQFRIEKRYLRKDGSAIWGRLSMSLFRGKDDEPAYAIGMVENITEQKQMRTELAELQRLLMESGENERLYLAQELHDGPLQDLQVINFQLSTLEMDSHLEDGDQDTLEQTKESLHEVSTALRAICGELRPPALVPFGLEKAIRSYLDQIHERIPDLQIEADLMQDEQSLPERVRLALFRIFQHTVLNVTNHAEAEHMWVKFALDDEQIELEIRDDGCGFQVPDRWIELVRQGHFGLVGALERAEAIGGKMQINSKPGTGTRIRVTVPRREQYQPEHVERFSMLFPES
ncbi:MAG: PAS domain S-box protein [Anaerolineales bacterium]